MLTTGAASAKKSMARERIAKRQQQTWALRSRCRVRIATTAQRPNVKSVATPVASLIRKSFGSASATSYGRRSRRNQHYFIEHRQPLFFSQQIHMCCLVRIRGAQNHGQLIHPWKCSGSRAEAWERSGSFKKGHKKVGGRQKGTPNLLFDLSTRMPSWRRRLSVGIDGNGSGGSSRLLHVDRRASTQKLILFF